MKPVEALQGAAMVGKTAGIPFRQVHKLTPVCVIDPNDVRLYARIIRTAVRKVERSRCCGAYLFVNPAMQAFVVHEEQAAAPVWVKERFAWLVGYYRTRKTQDPRIPILRPSTDGIQEDITDHLQQISAATGRECGGLQPAGEDNSRQPVNGSPRRGCNVSDRGSGEGFGHD